MPKIGAGAAKKLPKPMIIQHFLSLPEEKRVSLLRGVFSDAYLEELGKGEFDDRIKALTYDKDPEKKALKRFIADDNNVGGHWRDLLPIAKKRGAYHVESIFDSPSTDQEKVFQVIMNSTFHSRYRMFWEPVVKGKPKENFIRKGIAGLKSERVLSLVLDNQNNYAPGKGWGDFAAAVAQTMELSTVETPLDQLRKGIPENDPLREEKLQCAAQLCMLLPEDRLDPKGLTAKLSGEAWEKAFDPGKTLLAEKKAGKLNLDALTERVRGALERFPETEEETRILREAALQTCHDVKRLVPPYQLRESGAEKFVELSRELQEDAVKERLNEKAVSELRKGLDGDFATLAKVKSGFMLSKTNTPEHNDMMKHLRLFNAKLQVLSGKKLSELGLSPAEESQVKDSDVDRLFENARRGCYSYACKKTKNGKKGFVHEAGVERFDASLNALSKLIKLGAELRLTDPAAACRDEAQLQVLRNRRSKSWRAENVEKLAAKTIYAQDLLNKGAPVCRQKRLLAEEPLEAQITKLQNRQSFQKMVENEGREGLADAMIQGVTRLAGAYGEAHRNLKQSGAARRPSEIDPASLHQGNDPQALSPEPVR